MLPRTGCDWQNQEREASSRFEYLHSPASSAGRIERAVPPQTSSKRGAPPRSAMLSFHLVSGLTTSSYPAPSHLANGRRPRPAQDEPSFPLTEIQINCPHCIAPLIIATVMDTVKFGQRTCPKCGERFIIENNMPRMLDDGLKKPNASVKPAKNARKSGRRSRASSVTPRSRRWLYNGTKRQLSGHQIPLAGHSPTHR